MGKNKEEYLLRDTPWGHTIFGAHTQHKHTSSCRAFVTSGWVSARFLSGLVRSFDKYVMTAQSFCFPPHLLWRRNFCSSWCWVRGRHRSHLRMAESLGPVHLRSRRKSLFFSLFTKLMNSSQVVFIFIKHMKQQQKCRQTEGLQYYKSQYILCRGLKKKIRTKKITQGLNLVECQV